MNRKAINIIPLFVFAVILLCCSSISFALADIQKYRQDLKHAVRTLPESSIVLHDKLFKAGQAFESVGIFSEARRAYQYLDLIWDKYPPTDDRRHQLLKKKIASLKKKQDTPQPGALTLLK